MLPLSDWLHSFLKFDAHHLPSPETNSHSPIFEDIKMIQTIQPYSATRTAEIMSRYRPIAPKPESPITNSHPNGDTDENSSVPQGIRKSSYLRNVWANLQARPTRTRKRGRTAAFSPPPIKRTRNCLQGLSPPLLTNPSGPNNLPMHSFVNGFPRQISLVPLKCAGGLDAAVSTLAESVASLPIIRCATNQRSFVDLSKTANDRRIVQELDFMAQLKEPAKRNVIIPRAVRPIGSKILIVTAVNEDVGGSGPVVMGAQDVENEVELEKVPAVVSDSSNRVRFINSAYKEMVGQPECLWMDYVKAAECRRIGGEVVLRYGDSELEIMPENGFNCNVKIEWENNGRKSCVDAACKGVKLECGSKDYKFVWRFQVNES